MNNTYLLKLEEKVKKQEGIIANFQKEQTASIKVFKDKEKEIVNLNNSLFSLTNEKQKDLEKITQLQTRIKELTSKGKIRELTAELNETNSNLEKALKKKEQTESKSKLYQQKISDLEKQLINLAKEKIKGKKDWELLLKQLESNWEQEKEEILTNSERTRNEQDQEITELEKENNQLDQDLNKAVDLLESKDKTISDLQKQNQDLDYLLKTGKNSDIIKKLEAKIAEQGKTIEELKKQAKNKENIKREEKLFTCSSCNQEWSLEFLRLVDKKGNKTCAECLTEQLELTKQETNKEIKLEIEEKEPEPIFKPCQFCQQPKIATSLKPRHIKNLPNHDPREIILICQECLTYRAKKADYYCPRTSEGKDLYEGTEYDCYCPTNLNERRYL